MNKKINIRKYLIAAVASLAIAGALSAQGTTPDPSGATNVQKVSYGLLGENYSGLDYSYTHLDSSPLDNINGFKFRYNQALHKGLDFGLGYEWGRSNEVGNLRLKQQELTANVTAYFDHTSNLRPYIQPGIGWTWSKIGSGKSDSFLYFVGVGAEIQVAQTWVVSPYVQFVDATSYSGHDVNFGVKSTYRINRDWSLQGEISINDSHDTGLSLGVNYHF